ncbi:hypothetical protein OVA06_19460 [Pseudarthrobacter sp. SL88]|uniref:hypothetical protein n=1 Tax=Pseudarthrobacter sp. SL88 TaxID=2994666 RepID=UPI002276A00C|nr:hypothetical protein [Pseudarthrobacter sp. SL88]MCY1676851.1 hypothetical protein [Pseudarthrobacter sp. SL88]
MLVYISIELATASTSAAGGNMVNIAAHKSGLRVAALGLTAIVLAASGCAAPTAREEKPRSSSTPSSTPETPKTTPTTGQPVSSSNTALPIKGLTNDGKGEYLQTTISADDPAMKVIPETVDPSASERFTADEIQDAQRFIATFIAEETIDSILNANPTDRTTIDAWWSRNKDKVEPSNLDEFYADVHSADENKPLVMRGFFRDGKYDLMYGASQPHVIDRTLTPTSVKGGEVNGLKVVGINFDASYNLAANHNGEQVPETTTATISYTVTNEVTGHWQITGYYSHFNTIPAGDIGSR